MGPCVVTLQSATAVTAMFVEADTIPRLANISARGSVLTGNDVMIAGFIISGDAPKRVAVNARGPSLAEFDVQGALADPVVELFSGQTPIARNDNWQAAQNAAEIQSIGVAPPHALEASILATLEPGPYTAIVSGIAGGTGVGVVEVFEVDHPEIPLIGISTRGKVLTGEGVLIGGFIIEGAAPQTVVVRARGPSLAVHGVDGVLANPTLTLVPRQGPAITNDDWETAENAEDLRQSGFAPDNPLESAILVTLEPGAYTAILSGVAGGTGVGIVEVFAR